MEKLSTSGAQDLYAQDLYMSGDYLKLMPSWHVEESAGKVKTMRAMLASNKLMPASIFDIGCGAGEVLRLLQQTLPSTTELTGYDISPQALELAAPRANDRLHFVQGDMPRGAGERADLLLVLDVLEHLEDYFSFLRELRPHGTHSLFFFPLDLSVQTVLRPKGLLRLRDMYGHLHYFTRETALRTLTETGYTIVDARYTSEMIDLPTRLVGRNLIKYPRKALFALNQSVAAHLLGGYRLLVLARNAA